MRKIGLFIGALLVFPSAYAVLPYIFANQPSGNVPASYLDTDFSLVEGGIVQPAVSTGVANSYSVAPAVAWVGGYSSYANQGLLVNFNAGNTGPSSINVSGLGGANLVKNVGGVATTLTSGDINTNVPYLLINDGTQFWVQNVQGSSSAAAGSSNNVQYNNGGSLAGTSSFNFISSTNTISVTGVVATSATITSITNIFVPVASAIISTTSSSCSVISATGISGCIRISTGAYNVTFTTPMATTSYKTLCFPGQTANTFVVATASVGQSQRTDSFYFGAESFSGSVSVDNVRMNCVVFP